MVCIHASMQHHKYANRLCIISSCFQSVDTNLRMEKSELCCLGGEGGSKRRGSSTAVGVNLCSKVILLHTLCW